MLYADTELAIKEPEIKRVFPKEYRSLSDSKFGEMIEGLELRQRLNFIKTRNLKELNIFLAHFISMLKLRKRRTQLT